MSSVQFFKCLLVSSRFSLHWPVPPFSVATVHKYWPPPPPLPPNSWPRAVNWTSPDIGLRWKSNIKSCVVPQPFDTKTHPRQEIYSEFFTSLNLDVWFSVSIVVLETRSLLFFFFYFCSSFPFDLSTDSPILGDVSHRTIAERCCQLWSPD